MSTVNNVLDVQATLNLSEETVGIETKLIDFASEKTKVFFEALANISFYFSKISFLNAGRWSKCEKEFGAIKTAMSVPSFFKGFSTLYKNYNNGKLTFRKGYADLAFVVSDGIDTIKTLNTQKVVVLSDAFKQTIDKVKTVAGLIGLTKSIEDCYSDIAKLKAINPAEVVVAKEDKRDVAIEIRKRWVAAELRSKEYDMLKNITGYALCVLSLTIGFEPWKFAILGTAGLVGKFMSHYYKFDSSFWENKFVNVSS
jgi:hypothetical protein